MARLRIIARFRCCNEWRGERYWEEEGKLLCRICNEKKETWFHIKEECSTRTSLTEEEIISGKKEGIDWMRKVDKQRKDAKKVRRTTEDTGGEEEEE